jgi:phosphate transport system substrate-binding protein
VLKGKPQDNRALRDFMAWILTDGQKYVREAGYVPLTVSVTASELKKLE